MGQRNTIQRTIVLETLMRMKSHPTIEELYAEIYKDHPAISKTTVYRNLRVLEENGAVRRLSLPDGPDRYEGQPKPHYHFKCSTCGSVFDIDMPTIGDIDASVESKYGFEVKDHDLVFHGKCSDCKLL
ncbi:MAG: transcriptional repressor [Defluviitaleaceae bacterium]|nr:transcriptional repressor [Defluviitaleaceae bacterium]